MEVKLDSGERLSFTWRNSGELFIALVRDAPSGRYDEPEKQWPVAASCKLKGAELVQFLESFCVPMLRRALHLAIFFPTKGDHNCK